MNNPLEDKICNTRDVIEYKDWLEEHLLENLEEETLEDLEEYEEYKDVVEFINELVNTDAIENEETIIREDYWEEYVEDLVDSCGYIPKDFPDWISRHIDWKGVNEGLLVDYDTFTYKDYKYYIRL
jgi:hypothetical protein